MTDMIEHLRILQPYPGIFAYYDGRIAGKRLHGREPNWLDDGAFKLGIASFAIVSGDEALVYDTHISLDHARAIRGHLEGLGVKELTVVLSHFHNDHIAGNEVFADCEFIANTETARLLEAERPRIAQRAPIIDPVIPPTTLFAGTTVVMVGDLRVELHHFDIHSPDATVLWLPDRGLLFAGDTLEDTATYVTDADNLEVHLGELQRMAKWPIVKILPCHGDPDRIAAGGYEPSFIKATEIYVKRLMSLEIGEKPALKDMMADEIEAGSLIYLPDYEEVHEENLAAFFATKA
ncbi:MBL fold metallo-hydrolase [Ciceribacter sp. L1K23]|uniref:MBL fold metallo-hydrolase n=1 Tax=Ciceribacter sp. L1K23 TaxID=2820276 RepID=UPI001B80F6B7|nr:MBL fold metallo-hydrolase [Ciceribacter sp. L1K23]MBR0554537.1 MBL fold metallo-hydrolase [Ciceribacter sp. L1K23]